VTRIRLKYVQAWVDHEGRSHHYFRRPGFPRARLPGLPGSPEFMAAYQAALGAAMLPIGTNRSKPGTVAAAVAAFWQSPDFTRRAAGTRDQRRPILQRFRDQYGRMPMGLLPPKFIHAKLGEMKPHAARNWFKTIRALCQFCVLEELIQIDPTASLKTDITPGLRTRSPNSSNSTGSAARPTSRWRSAPTPCNGAAMLLRWAVSTSGAAR
jgi:hypothetical protein